MMNIPSATNSCDEFGGYVPPNTTPPPPPQQQPSLLPIMDQESGIQREHHLGYNLEASSLALLPPSNGGGAGGGSHHHGGATIAHAPHDILQFYPTSHYLAAAAGNPYSHFAGGTATAAAFQSYYQQPAAAAPPEYYFPTLVSSAEENMASFAATQLGLNLGYRTYFPPRGGYTYGHHPPRCQAEGCKADLSSAKRYHRRHKVCEHHSKAPVVVTAGGLHQRFCQQCSRFHLLDEFDDAKKSCRKRLADHNRRRRKSKPSDADAADKRRAQANKSATSKDKAGSSSKNTSSMGDVLETQVLGGAHMSSKDQDHTMGLGEVVKEAVDPKGKASMQTHHHGHSHGLHHHQQQQQNSLGFPFPSSSGSCFPQSQAVSSVDHNTSNNIAQVQQEQPSLGFHQHHHHQHSNILQLGQAMFDLDFDH